ncbi:MAG TPA: LamG domain-containing protein, partial [Chitinivibrionales bacterium]
FMPFPDNDGNTLALFHFDNNNLINSVQNGNTGTGTVTYTTANAAFNGSINSGSFNATLSQSIGANNDFTVECWIKPPSTNQASTMVSGSGFSFGLTADGYLLATIGNTSIKPEHVIDKSVWQCVAVARTGGKAAIYINGIPMATATAAAGAIPTALSISSISGGLLDEVRISSVVRSKQIQGKTIVQLPLASQLLWNINNVQTTGQTARLPFAMLQGVPAGQVQFMFSSSLPGPMIINFFDTSSSPVSIMWSKNGDPVLFSTTGLAVSATLRDTSHEGHLDMIDLKWSENSTIATPLPAVGQLVLSVTIVTLDGKGDTLHPAGVVLDAANKVIHIILSENNSKARGKYETGWVDGSAKIVISPDLKITTDGKPIVITQIIDGATPIPTSSCYANSQNLDSLWVTFSEPLTKDTSVSKNNILRDSTTQRLTQLGPTFSGRVGDRMLFVFPINGGNHLIVPYSNKISEFFSPGPNSPTVEISYCSNNKLIEKILVGPNPVSQTNPPDIKITAPDGTQISAKGIKI